MITAHIELEISELDVINPVVHRWTESVESEGRVEQVSFFEVEWDRIEWLGNIVELDCDGERELEDYLSEVHP